MDYYERAGYAKAVDDLVSAVPLLGEQPTDDALAPLNAIVRNLRGRAAPVAIDEIQLQWVRRMITTQTPLVERMTLFLHDHWATGYRPADNIDTPELAAQNETFRQYALGNWRSLCHAMIDDVALSCWLDNDVNHKEHPNENLAREFMELFTLGIGNYTEQDIREAARALTGMELSPSFDLTATRRKMVFNPAKHDARNKTILGRTGAWMPHDFVDIALAQPIASRYIARKMALHFVGPSASTALSNAAGDAMVASGWKLSEALRTIFLSSEFRSQAVRANSVKSPAEFVVGALRALGLTGDEHIRIGLRWMNKAGQVLFDPPNVGGWPANEGWLGGGGILARYNAAAQLADGHVAKFTLPGQTRLRGGSPDAWAEIFGVTDLAAATRSAMNGYLYDSKTTDEVTLDAAMITLFISSPDFTLA